MTEEAGLFDRGMALLIDTVLVLGIFGLSGIIVFEVYEAVSGASVGFNPLYIFVSVGFFLYFIYFEGRSGQTPAKLFLNLKVQRKDGSEIGYLSSLARNLLRLVDVLPNVYIIGILFIFFTSENQRFGDLIARTVVVDEGGQEAQISQEL